MNKIFKNKIIVYGTGGTAKKFIEDDTDIKGEICAVVGKNVGETV